jgi:hypothetical protein
VALESALQDQLFGHVCGDEAMQRIKVLEEEREIKGCSAKPRPSRKGRRLRIVPALFFVWVKN